MSRQRRTTAWDLADQHRSQSTRRTKRPAVKTSVPRLKDHFPRLIQFVYLSRYATADQVQARFPGIFVSDRTCRRHLKQLVDMGYLTCADVKSTGVNWPNVYLCTIKGTKLLREHFNLALPNAREEARSLASIEHELFLTEFDLACLSTVSVKPHLDILYQERRYFHQDKRLKFQTTVGHHKHLIPDGGFMLKVTNTNPAAYLQLFVELDNGTELPSVVLAKFRTYHQWVQSPSGQSYLHQLYRRFGSKHPRATFRLLVIARRRTLLGHDDKRLADLFVQALQLPDALRHAMWLTSVDLLKAHQHENPPLAGRFWLKAGDADVWRPDFCRLAASLNHEKGSRPGKLKRQYVLEQMPQLPRHHLFP